MTACLCECPGCPLLPYCDGCDPPRLATWSGYGLNGCDVCVSDDHYYGQHMTPGRPDWSAYCQGCEPGECGICSVEPMTAEEEARLRGAFTARAPYWNRDWDNLALLATIDAARRERDAARAEVERVRADAAAMAYGADLEMASRTVGKLEASDEENRLRRLLVALWQGGEAEALASVERQAKLNRALTLFAHASKDLHAALCEGAFKINRDPMDLQPVFYALQGQHVSCGWARTAVRRWLAGLPVQVPEYATEDLTFKARDAIEHLQRIAAGLEYDTDGRAHILDTDVAVLRGAICGLREKAAEAEAIAADLAREVKRLRVEVAELRANVDPSR